MLYLILIKNKLLSLTKLIKEYWKNNRNLFWKIIIFILIQQTIFNLILPFFKIVLSPWIFGEDILELRKINAELLNEVKRQAEYIKNLENENNLFREKENKHYIFKKGMTFITQILITCLFNNITNKIINATLDNITNFISPASKPGSTDNSNELEN